MCTGKRPRRREHPGLAHPAKHARRPRKPAPEPRRAGEARKSRHCRSAGPTPASGSRRRMAGTDLDGMTFHRGNNRARCKARAEEIECCWPPFPTRRLHALHQRWVLPDGRPASLIPCRSALHCRHIRPDEAPWHGHALARLRGTWTPIARNRAASKNRGGNTTTITRRGLSIAATMGLATPALAQSEAIRISWPMRRWR